MRDGAHATIWLMAAVLSLCATALAAEPAPAGEGESEAERAARIVRELGDDSWEKREAASRDLTTMGLVALPLVEAALKSADAEVSMRAAAAAEAVRRNAKREIGERCLIRDLFFCGPFPFSKDEAAPLELAFPPEQGYEPGAVHRTGEVEARWRRPWPAGARGAVDFDAVFGHHEHAVAYALTSVRVEGREPRRLLLLLGSDDSVRVWVNGRVVHTNPEKRGVTADQDAASVTLDPGWNDVLVKVVQFGGAWGVCLRLTEPDRAEAAGIVWDATRGGERQAPAPPAPKSASGSSG
jgi:hypothetical protein